MNILFLTLLDFKSYAGHNIYCDLLRECIRHGHEVYCISPAERRTGIRTHLNENGHLLKLRIGNTQKTNIVEKGISTLIMETQFKNAIRKYFRHVPFDLVIYSTPPITLQKAVAYVKKRDHAETYLLLKDIFPQNSLDLGMLSTTGWKGVIYRYFRSKEKKLYSISDRIGCMSQANVDYVIKHNPDMNQNKVEVCPNCIEIQDVLNSAEDHATLRKKYDIPLDQRVFVYGGNLGKPQGVPFIIECLRACQSIDEVFFLIVGSGTDYSLLEQFVADEKLENVRLLPSLPKDEYDRMLATCDVGLIFLDHRFTIPNFPSRLLSYMQAGLPVLACTDTATDLRQVIVNNNFGWWCESNHTDGFVAAVSEACQAARKTLGANGYKYLCGNYTAVVVYSTIVRNSR